jgi:hypothetical protein
MNPFAHDDDIPLEPRSRGVIWPRRPSIIIRPYFHLMLGFPSTNIAVPLSNGRPVRRKSPVFTTLASVSAARHYFPTDDVFEHMFSFLRGSVVVMFAHSPNWTTLEKKVCFMLHNEQARLRRQLSMFVSMAILWCRVSITDTFLIL